MFATIFAFLGSWVSIFILIGIAAVIWLFVKAAGDLVTWFREEILDNPYDNRRSRKRRSS